MPRPTDHRLLDELTGLSNEWHFRILYDFAFAGGDRGIPVALVLFEIEDLDGYRVRQGRHAAEEAVRHFGAILANTTREMDLSARLDGGRFLTMLRDCNLPGALVFADRVQVQAEGLAEEHGLTVAMGVAAYEEEMEESEELLDAAAAALRQALEEGGGSLHTSRDSESRSTGAQLPGGSLPSDRAR